MFLDNFENLLNEGSIWECFSTAGLCIFKNHLGTQDTRWNSSCLYQPGMLGGL